MFSFSVRDFLFLSFIKFESLVNFVLKSREIAYIIEIIYTQEYFLIFLEITGLIFKINIHFYLGINLW